MDNALLPEYVCLNKTNGWFQALECSSSVGLGVVPGPGGSRCGSRWFQAWFQCCSRWFRAWFAEICVATRGRLELRVLGSTQVASLAVLQEHFLCRSLE